MEGFVGSLSGGSELEVGPLQWSGRDDAFISLVEDVGALRRQPPEEHRWDST
jgi:hypothetical protein